MPVKVLVSASNVADCTEASALIRDIKAENLIANRSYDTNDIVEAATKASIQAVIAPKKNQKNIARV